MKVRRARKTTTPQMPPWGSPPRRRRVCRRCSPFQPRPSKTPARYSETRFPLEAMSILGHSFRLKPIRKARPTLKLDSGIQLPPETSTGNGIPLWSQNPGRSFRLRANPESASQSELIPGCNFRWQLARQQRGPVPAIRGQALPPSSVIPLTHLGKRNQLDVSPTLRGIPTSLRKATF